MDTPEWVTNTRRAWMEDDARPHDRERLSDAWARIFGESFPPIGSAIDYFDGGDAEYHLFANGRIAVTSYPGACEIRTTEQVKP